MSRLSARRPLVAVLVSLFVLLVAVPAGASAATSTLTAGEGHACAVKSDGTVACWGSNHAGQLGPTASVFSSSTPVAVGGLANVTDVAAGDVHTCALKTDGTVWCWGDNGKDQLGGTPGFGLEALVQVPGVAGAVGIASGDEHSCALLAGGHVKCWGSNSNGQLGGGTGNGIADAVRLGAGGDATCAVRLGGQVKCWGRVIVPTPPLTDAVALAGGDGHACALRTGGGVVCWGLNGSGQLGDGTTDAAAVNVSGLSDAVAIGAGVFHSCAVRAGGTVSCWGDNSDGQLGDGTTTERHLPVPVAGVTGATAVVSGWDFSCALLGSGAVRCWGGNRVGQLGNGKDTESATPVLVPGLTTAKAISGGEGFGCVIRGGADFATVGGAVSCWGLGGGFGSSPQAISGISASSPSGAIAIDGGNSQTCILRVDKTMRCWGSNERGQLGTGPLDGTVLTPVDPGLTNVTAFSAGRNQTCAVIGSPGTIRCWGDYWYFGSARIRVPSTASAIANALKVVVGNDHVCVLRSGGSVSCWGLNNHVQVGVPSTGGLEEVHEDAPVTVPGIADALDIVALGDRTCALRPLNTVTCWGSGAPGPATKPELAGAVELTTACTLFTGGSVTCPFLAPLNGLADAKSTADVNGFGNAACVLQNAGTVRCFGTNYWGILGDGCQPAGHYPCRQDAAPVVSLAGVRQPAAPRTVAPSDVRVTQAPAFADTTVGTSSTAVVTITNTYPDATPLFLAGGAPPTGSDFAKTSTTCGQTLAVGASCTVTYTFSPSVLGARTATATLSLAGGTVPLTFSGQGVSGFVVAPTTLAFPATATGATSAPLSITIINASGTTRPVGLSGGDAAPAADFTMTGTTCGATLGLGATCTVSYTFHPSGPGVHAGTATLTVAGTTYAVTLSGAAPIPPVAAAAATPAGPAVTLPSGGVTLGSLSAGLTFTLSGAKPRTAYLATAQLGKKVLARKRGTIPAGGSLKVKLKFNAAARKKLKGKKKFTLKVVFTTATGKKTTLTKTVKIKR